MTTFEPLIREWEKRTVECDARQWFESGRVYRTCAQQLREATKDGRVLFVPVAEEMAEILTGRWSEPVEITIKDGELICRTVGDGG